MRIEVTDDAAEFRRRAGGFLARDPLRHTVIATAVDNALGGVADESALWASVHSDGLVIGAAMQSGANNVFLGDVPDLVIAELATEFAERRPDAHGVEGVPGVALVFAERWRALSGRAFRVDFSTRLYRLGTLRIPAVPGILRAAIESDLDLCVRWQRDMQREVGVGMSTTGIRARIEAGRWWLWEDGGRPVAMAAHSGPCYGWGRIGSVFTPPESRGHGYASALTAGVSKRLRAKGSDVCLFADVENPTSNKIYRAIGFEPVRTLVDYEFEPTIA
ncbi:GNAT family N-acetyltransferase [Nocardia terpenica]|uniref:Acetyltransferase n=1 Tax=Nocardia terpenica TaxID=455432 RepID=A0A291RSH5_9NOCA|nr:GNAT family N-acetyltransferase [Nocardia terpenica]ATL70277.1 acetyltransferase [Nocardia terpenica]